MAGLKQCLLGMGNPLLDIIADVDDAFLSKYEVRRKKAKLIGVRGERGRRGVCLCRCRALWECTHTPGIGSRREEARERLCVLAPIVCRRAELTAGDAGVCCGPSLGAHTHGRQGQHAVLVYLDVEGGKGGMGRGAGGQRAEDDLIARSNGANPPQTLPSYLRSNWPTRSWPRTSTPPCSRCV